MPAPVDPSRVWTGALRTRLPPLDRGDLGIAVLVPAVLAVTALAVALASGDGRSAVGFAATGALGGAVGGALRAGASDRGPRDPDAIGPTVALGWLLASVLAAAPVWWIGAAPGADPAAAIFADPLNAWFESMSGLTSTGLSVSPDASGLPPALQWWRSALQWVGAIGILTLAFAVASDHPSSGHGDEADAEGSDTGLRTIWGLYGGYTAAAVAALAFAGMPPWAAVNHGVTAIATGGFAITGDSLAGYPPLAQAVAAGVMVVGAVSFAAHAAVLLRRRPGRLLRSAEHRLLAALLVVGAVATVAVLAMADADAGAWEGTFAWVSALTTAGFSIGPLPAWPVPPLLLLVLAMVVGGAAGSTTGGLKQRRLLWLGRGALGRASEAERARRVRPALRQLARVSATLAVGAALLWLWSDAPWHGALFEAASALGTVGLSSGLTDAELSRPARIVLVGLMWAGRLEVWAVLSLAVRGGPPDDG